MRNTIIVAILMSFAGLAGAQDKMAEALRKGIVEEESKQNLNAAIQAYQSVVTQFGEQRKTAATALFRLAEVYRKQGKNPEAVAAYARVVREFPEQTELVAQSRKHVPAATVQAGITRQASEAERRLLDANVALINERVKAASEHLRSVERDLQLGARSSEEVSRARIMLLEAERERAAFQAARSIENRDQADETLRGLDAALANAQRELARSREQYNDNHPVVRNLQTRIDNLIREREMYRQRSVTPVQ